MWSKLILIFLLLTTQVAWSEEEVNCTFSSDGIHKPTFKSSDTLFSQMTDKAVYYAVLKKGKYVYAQYWTCEHFGFGVDYYIPSEKYKDEQLKEEMLYLAKNILEDIDYKEFEKKIVKVKKLLNKPFTIEHSRFSQFRISIKSINYSVMISFNAYM